MPKALDAIAALKGAIAGVADRPSLDQPAVNVPAAGLVAAMAFLRDQHGFDMLVDVAGVDWSQGVSPRFTVVYHLLSTTDHDYVRVAADCRDDASPELPSVTSLWHGANWHEREAFDMFGIRFTGHPDLRRILMWDGYPHNPLRKDFPLSGVDTDLPDREVVAETRTNAIAAPMVGGPFVASQGEINMTDAEPRAKDESWNERRPKPGA